MITVRLVHLNDKQIELLADTIRSNDWWSIFAHPPFLQAWHLFIFVYSSVKVTGPNVRTHTQHYAPTIGLIITVSASTSIDSDCSCSVSSLSCAPTHTHKHGYSCLACAKNQLFMVLTAQERSKHKTLISLLPKNGMKVCRRWGGYVPLFSSEGVFINVQI